MLPLVPVMVKVELPVGVEPDVVTVSVALPAPLMDDGLKEAVAPAGRPAMVRPMLPAKPLIAVVEMV